MARFSTWQQCAAGCSAQVHGGPGKACDACWGRLPQALRKEYHNSRSLNAGPYARPASAVLTEIEEWWAANPPPPAEPSVPAWKIDRRGKKE